MQAVQNTSVSINSITFLSQSPFSKGEWTLLQNKTGNAARILSKAAAVVGGIIGAFTAKERAGALAGAIFGMGTAAIVTGNDTDILARLALRYRIVRPRFTSDEEIPHVDQEALWELYGKELQKTAAGMLVGITVAVLLGTRTISAGLNTREIMNATDSGLILSAATTAIIATKVALRWTSSVQTIAISMVERMHLGGAFRKGVILGISKIAAGLLAGTIAGAAVASLGS